MTEPARDEQKEQMVKEQKEQAELAEHVEHAHPAEQEHEQDQDRDPDPNQAEQTPSEIATTEKKSSQISLSTPDSVQVTDIESQPITPAVLSGPSSPALFREKDIESRRESPLVELSNESNDIEQLEGTASKELEEEEKEEEEAESGFESDFEIDENDPLDALISEVEKSMDNVGPVGENGEILVPLPEDSTEIRKTLFTEGPLMFLAKYRFQQPQQHTVPQLLAALGFCLPQTVAESYSPQQFEMVLQLAIRHVLNNRPRLPAPRTLDEICELIDKSQRIIVVTGAGISTSLGIPDFRSDNGLYAQLEHLGLSDPQEVFDINLFREDPSIFYSIASKVLPEEKRFSPTHHFIRMLADRGKLLRNYTQNIDNLEEAAGVPSELVVQCHGSFGSAHCFTCKHEVDGDTLFTKIRNQEIPKCPRCWSSVLTGKRKREGKHTHQRPGQNGVAESDDDEDDLEPSFGIIKPDITFFGESLPGRFDDMLFKEDDAHKADLLLCIGTSLKVAPVSEIVKVVERDIPQVYISKTPASHCNFEMTFLGPCDDVIELLSHKLGWPLNHPMARRPAGMADNEFPGGSIEHDDDGVYSFTDTTTASDASPGRLDSTRLDSTRLD